MNVILKQFQWIAHLPSNKNEENKEDNPNNNFQNQRNNYFIDERKNYAREQLLITEDRLKLIYEHKKHIDKNNDQPLQKEMLIREAKVLLRERKKWIQFMNWIDKEKDREMENDFMKMKLNVSKQRSMKSQLDNNNNIKESKKQYLDQCENARKQKKRDAMLNVFLQEGNENDDDYHEDNNNDSDNGIEKKLNRLFDNNVPYKHHDEFQINKNSNIKYPNDFHLESTFVIPGIPLQSGDISDPNYYRPNNHNHFERLYPDPIFHGQKEK